MNCIELFSIVFFFGYVAYNLYNFKQLGTEKWFKKFFSSLEDYFPFYSTTFVCLSLLLLLSSFFLNANFKHPVIEALFSSGLFNCIALFVIGKLIKFMYSNLKTHDSSGDIAYNLKQIYITTLLTLIVYWIVWSFCNNSVAAIHFILTYFVMLIGNYCDFSSEIKTLWSEIFCSGTPSRKACLQRGRTYIFVFGINTLLLFCNLNS